MSIDTGWLALGALALLVVWLGATVWRAGGRARARAPFAAESPATAVAVAPTTFVSDRAAKAMEPRQALASPAGAVRAEAAPRVTARAVAPQSAVPPVVPAATAAAAVSARAQAARFERVLAIELSNASAWHAAQPLPLGAGQAQAVAALCGPAFDAARREPGQPGPVLALAFPPATILRIARGDAALLKAVAADNDGSTLRALYWLDSNAASALATTLLAALATERHLDALGTQAHELRAAVAGLRSTAANSLAGRLEAAVQELWRLQRDVRANPAAALVKPALRQQADDALAGAVLLWRELHAALDAARVGRTSAVGEMGHLQELGARTLAAAHVLRAGLGGAPAPAGVHPLQSASAAWRAGAADAAASRGTVEVLMAAYAVCVEGFPDASGGDDRWLVCGHGGADGVEVRRAPVVRLH